METISQECHKETCNQILGIKLYLATGSIKGKRSICTTPSPFPRVMVHSDFIPLCIGHHLLILVFHNNFVRCQYLYAQHRQKCKRLAFADIGRCKQWKSECTIRGMDYGLGLGFGLELGLRLGLGSGYIWNFSKSNHELKSGSKYC